MPHNFPDFEKAMFLIEIYMYFLQSFGTIKYIVRIGEKDSPMIFC